MMLASFTFNIEKTLVPLLKRVFSLEIETMSIIRHGNGKLKEKGKFMRWGNYVPTTRGLECEWGEGIDSERGWSKTQTRKKKNEN